MISNFLFLNYKFKNNQTFNIENIRNINFCFVLIEWYIISFFSFSCKILWHSLVILIRIKLLHVIEVIVLIVFVVLIVLIVLIILIIFFLEHHMLHSIHLRNLEVVHILVIRILIPKLLDCINFVVPSLLLILSTTYSKKCILSIFKITII